MTRYFNKDRLMASLSGVILLISYYFIFERFFPNKTGTLGHDYSSVIPSLLDNFIWYQKNGLFAVPWFTPSFCGGFLNFTHPQSISFSLPVIFTSFLGPLSAVKLTFIVFASAGFLGFYLLLRRVYLLSHPSSLLGAGLFLFNGFYSHRMIIGHFSFYSFMLIPLISFFLLRPVSPDKIEVKRIVSDIFIAGFLFACMLHAGFTTLMLPGVITIVILGIIHGLIFSNRVYFWVRFAGSGVVGILLSASKLMTIYYIMTSFTRSEYKLPGINGIAQSAITALKSLFISPAFDGNRFESLVNVQWLLERHEWEYSLTVVPLLIIIWGFFIFGARIIKNGFYHYSGFFKKHWLEAGFLVLLLFMPVALNTYTPAWNAFLKKIPVIKSASSLIRWFFIYIPFVVLVTSIITEKYVKQSLRWPVVIAGMLAVVFINHVTDHEFYHKQGYDPQEIDDAYNDLKDGSWVPEIRNVMVYLDKNGQVEFSIAIDANNMFIHNGSQMYCYEPLLGYRLEYFPWKTLHPGAILEKNNGFLNIKNPACYVWPDANSCDSGDHFSVGQINEAMAFASYRPFNFQIPIQQRIANRLNITALIIFVLFFGYSLVSAVISGIRKD